MNELDLGDLERRHSTRLWRPPVWVSVLGVVVIAGNVVSTAARGGPWWLVAVWVVVLVGVVVSPLGSRRGGEQVTCLEPGRVGTGTTTWRGALELTWWPWEQVERVQQPGRWDDGGVRLVLRDGGERSLPGVSAEDARRLTDALVAARGAPEQSEDA